MKVYINRLPVSGPWGGGAAFINAFHKRATQKCELIIDPTGTSNPDVILLAGLDNDGYGISAEQAIMYKLYVKPDCKIVLRVNENDARKGTNNVDRTLTKVSEHVDGTVFVSEWLKGYFADKGWGCKNQAVIRNGVASDVFKPMPKLDNGKLNVVAHHWSDNRMKGADIYERIDQFVGEHPDKYAFTYIGRHKCSFKHTTVVKPLAGRALGEELGKHDLYVSGSLYDPGPNHVLEALSCGLPTVVDRRGGGAVEFAGHSHSFRDWNDLEAILLAKGAVPNTNGVALTSWTQCIQEYTDYLEAVWKGSAQGSASSSSST